MTAINCFRTPTRGIMMTDSAFYTDDGKVVAFDQKAFPVPGLDAVVAVRGPKGLAEWFADAFAKRYADFDDLSGRIEEDLRDCYYADLRAGHLDADSHAYELQILGWSKDENSAKIYVFAADHGFNGEPVFETHLIMLSPSITDEERPNLAAMKCRLGEDFGPANFDPEFHGVQIMEAQRRDTDMTCSECEDEHHIVGGSVLLTEVRPGHVTQRIVHRWNDRIGEHIKVEPFRLPSEPVAGSSRAFEPKGSLSRADRRRQAKLSRKKVA